LVGVQAFGDPLFHLELLCIAITKVCYTPHVQLTNLSKRPSPEYIGNIYSRYL
jgi:hypothetical protein